MNLNLNTATSTSTSTSPRLQQPLLDIAAWSARALHLSPGPHPGLLLHRPRAVTSTSAEESSAQDDNWTTWRTLCHRTTARRTQRMASMLKMGAMDNNLRRQ